jgi:hypothetical protein
MSNLLPDLAATCGNSFASERGVLRTRGFESTQLTAANRLEDAVWQKRSRSEALRKTFTNTGISKPFGKCSEMSFVFRNTALYVVYDREKHRRTLLIGVRVSNIFEL